MSSFFRRTSRKHQSIQQMANDLGVGPAAVAKQERAAVLRQKRVDAILQILRPRNWTERPALKAALEAQDLLQGLSEGGLNALMKKLEREKFVEFRLVDKVAEWRLTAKRG